VHDWDLGLNWFEDGSEGEAATEDENFCMNYVLSELIAEKYPKEWFSNIPCNLQLLITYIEINQLWKGQDIDQNLKSVKEKIMQDYFIKYDAKELCYKFDYDNWNEKKITKSKSVSALQTEREKDKIIYKLLRDYWDDLFFESSKQKKCNTFKEVSSSSSKQGYINQLCNNFKGTCYLDDGSKFKWKDGSYQDFPDPRMYYNLVTASYDYEKLKTDLRLYINTKYAALVGLNAESSNDLQYNYEQWLSNYAEYMYEKGSSEIDGISASNQQNIKQAFYNIWGNTDENGFYWKWHTLNSSRLEQERQEYLAKLRGEQELNEYLEALEEGRVEAWTEIAFGTSGLIFTGILYATSEADFGMSIPLAAASGTFSTDKISGGIRTLNAINKGLFDSHKEYKVIKGFLVDNLGSAFGAMYDLGSIFVDLRLGLEHVTTINGADFEGILKAVSSGQDFYEVGDKTYKFVNKLKTK
jgi:hypothetical protein